MSVLTTSECKNVHSILTSALKIRKTARKLIYYTKTQKQLSFMMTYDPLFFFKIQLNIVKQFLSGTKQVQHEEGVIC